MKLKIIILLSLFPLITFSQLGGKYVYNFVTIPSSARSLALGGSAIGISDNDITLARENPAIYSKETDGKLAISYLNYISDINIGFVSFSRHSKGVGTFGFGIQYLNGGNFIMANDVGEKIGKFNVSEISFNVSFARSFDSVLNIGITAKPTYSKLGYVSSLGILLDAGILYNSRKTPFSAAIVAKNMGAQITKYYEETAPVPFEIQAGFAVKLSHAPFRFSVVGHHLQHPDLTAIQKNFPEPTNSTQDNTEEEKDFDFVDKFMRHVILGVEFTPTKSFFVRGGFNYMTRQELKLTERPGMLGFSWGFGFRIKKLHFSYSNVKYHYGGASNNITITTNISSFLN